MSIDDLEEQPRQDLPAHTVRYEVTTVAAALARRTAQQFDPGAPRSFTVGRPAAGQ